MTMGIGKDGYYSLRDILGYNCQYNLVYSDRGRGKTYGTKNMIAQAEGRFMCLYLDMNDMEHALESWTDDLMASGNFEPEQLQIEGTQNAKQLLINGEIKGYFRYLTAVRHIKHEKFNQNEPDKIVTWLWIDEFITPTTGKLKGVACVGDAIRMVVDTLDHDKSHPRETRGLKSLRVLMFANPFTWDDPHGINAYFHVVPMGYGIKRAGPGVVYEILEPLPDRSGGKLTTEKFLGDNVTKNMQYASQDSFVEKIPKRAMPFMSVRFGWEYFHVYRSSRNSAASFHIKRGDKHKNIMSQINPGELAIYGTLDGLQEDEVCLGKTHWIKHWQQLLYRGSLHFDDINTKFRFINAITTFST